MKIWLWLSFLLLGSLSCLDEKELARSSFGASKDARADGASVISMGRDDDDGKAIKWHIGGAND